MQETFGGTVDAPVMTPNSLAARLGRVDLLQRACADSLLRVARAAKVKVVPGGSEVYRQGDPARAMYVVLSGQVRLHRDGEEVALVGPDEACGAWALLDPSARVASATATTRTTVLELTTAAYLRIRAECGDVARSIHYISSERLLALASSCSLAVPDGE